MSTKKKIVRKKLFGMVLPEWMDENVLKNLTYSVLGLVFTLLVSMLFIWPKFADLTSRQRKIKNKEKQEEVLSMAVKRLNEVGLVNDETGVERLKLAIPTSFRPDYILVSLKDLSRKAGVAIEAYVFESGGVVAEEETEVKTEKKEETKRVKNHQVSLTVSGLPENLIVFVESLNNSLPYSSIVDMSMSQVSRVIISQDVSKLEMKIDFYEIVSGEVETSSITALTEREIGLFEEIKGWYKAGNLVSGEGSNILPGGRSSDLFGN